MDGYGYLSMTVVHMLFDLSSLSAAVSALSYEVLWGWMCYNSCHSGMGNAEVHTCTCQSQWLALLQACF